jgi:zinc protease
MFGLAILLLFARPESAVREFRLANGMRVLVDERHGAPLVAIDLWVRAGSGVQRPDEDGVAHFLEHMIFKGTATRKPGEIDTFFEDLGSLVTAGTTRDGAHFYSTIASAHLDHALEAMSDIVRNASLPAEEMERERAVILDELAQGRNDWRKQAVDIARLALYPSEPYARPIVGAADSIKRVTREQVQTFFKRWYLPGNAVLVLVGDVDPGTVESAVKRAFGEWRTGEIPSLPAFNTHEASDQVTAVFPTESAKSVICLAYRGPAGNEPDAIACARIITALLADSAGGRLAGPLQPYCGRSDWGADFTVVRGPSVLAFFGATSVDNADAVRAAISVEIQRLADSPVSRAEVDAVRRRTLGSLMFEEETYAGRARSLGSLDVAGGLTLAQQFTGFLNAVGPREIQEFARKWLKGGAAVIFRPKGKL